MVGKIFTANRATFGQLDMKKTLKVVGRFIHNDAEGMKRIFAKAEAKIEAKEAVFNAIKGLNRVGQYRSPDLRYLDSIITKARGSATGEQRDNPDFRVALFDAAWKKSAGQGKLGILLKKRGGFIDGTRALKSDLRKLAKPAMGSTMRQCLAALLEAIKKHAKNEQADAPIPADIIELLKDGSGASKLLTVDFDALERESIPGLIYHVGQALTEFLHPEFLSAEIHSAEGSDNRQMDSRNVL